MITLTYDNQGKIYSHIRKKYLVATPEEKVRQEFVCTLHNVYEYSLEQMDEELKTKDGKGSTRADIVIWKTKQDKDDKNKPLIIVECKANNIKISSDDYAQGESYARIVGADFLVTHNHNETKFWRLMKDKVPGFMQEIANIPKNNATQKEIEKLLKELVVFKEDEFANLLKKCHNIIRDAEALDPAAAFDEISKILFMKVFVERDLLKNEAQNKFTTAYIQESKKYGNNSVLDIFDKTKRAFAKDEIFEKNEKINLKENTILQIVKELEIYNLSQTSSDIKGIAFEKFLGTTFRGEIGQFFTPRPIVEFMVEMINPKENEICLDPTSGSGGFLIRIFNKIRDDIQKDLNSQYEAYKKEIIKDDKEPTQEQAKLINEKYDELQKQLINDDPKNKTRLFHLSNNCIFGTDKNERMARTSKMNMIMHGDGHGGIHHHNGLLNVNGIFDSRFDVILTNPPFGSQVSSDDKILDSDSSLNADFSPKDDKEDYIKEYFEKYGEQTYINAQRQILDNINKPIASVFDLKENYTSDKTEHLFINRCLNLLKSGGRMGIVLPESVFNGNNNHYVRKYIAKHAFIRAIISLPLVFKSAKASVKTSLLFLQKFTKEQKKTFDDILDSHIQNLKSINVKEIENLKEIISYKRQKSKKTPKYSKEDKGKARRELKELESKI